MQILIEKSKTVTTPPLHRVHTGPIPGKFPTVSDTSNFVMILTACHCIFNCLCNFYISYRICAGQQPSVRFQRSLLLRHDKGILRVCNLITHTLGKQVLVKGNNWIPKNKQTPPPKKRFFQEWICIYLNYSSAAQTRDFTTS